MVLVHGATSLHRLAGQIRGIVKRAQRSQAFAEVVVHADVPGSSAVDQARFRGEPLASELPLDEKKTASLCSHLLLALSYSSSSWHHSAKHSQVQAKENTEKKTELAVFSPRD